MYSWQNKIKQLTQHLSARIKQFWCGLRNHAGVVLDNDKMTVTCKRCKKVGMNVLWH